MSRTLLLVAALAALLLLPAAASGKSSVSLRGTVSLKDQPHGLVSVRALRKAVVLRVPGSLAKIRVGQRVELRGATLRTHGDGSRILARDVSILRSQPLAQAPTTSASDDDPLETETADDDDNSTGCHENSDDNDDSTGSVEDNDDDCGPGGVEDEDDNGQNPGPGGGGAEDDD